MRVIDIIQSNGKINNTGIALGNFDGIHLGHQSLINEVVNTSKRMKISPSVLLFMTNSKETVRKKEIKLLTSMNQKLEILESLGIENAYIISFTEEFMKMSPGDFINNILLEKLDAKLVVVGFDYFFGYKARGTVQTLKEYSEKKDYILKIKDAVKLDGEIISSSKIRELISKGNIKDASRLLERPYQIEAEIVAVINEDEGIYNCLLDLKLDCNYVIPDEGVYYIRLQTEQNEAFLSVKIDNRKNIYKDRLIIEFKYYENIMPKLNDRIRIDFIERLE